MVGVDYARVGVVTKITMTTTTAARVLMLMAAAAYAQHTYYLKEYFGNYVCYGTIGGGKVNKHRKIDASSSVVHFGTVTYLAIPVSGGNWSVACLVRHHSFDGARSLTDQLLQPRRSEQAHIRSKHGAGNKRRL